MIVGIYLPAGTDVSKLNIEYPDLELEEQGDETDVYTVGFTSDEEGYENDLLSFDECVTLCGFVAGLIPGSESLIEGNGAWAQGMISRKDFSKLAIGEKERKEFERISGLFWDAHARAKSLNAL